MAVPDVKLEADGCYGQPAEECPKFGAVFYINIHICICMKSGPKVCQSFHFRVVKIAGDTPVYYRNK